MSYMSVYLFVPPPLGLCHLCYFTFVPMSKCQCPVIFVFLVLNGWEGKSLLRCYWCLQTWVTKYWTMWTSDKICLDKIPLRRHEYKVPPPTKKLFAIVTCGKGEKRQFSPTEWHLYVNNSLEQALCPGIVEKYKCTPCFPLYFGAYNNTSFPFVLPSLPIYSFLLAFKFMELCGILCVNFCFGWYFVSYWFFIGFCPLWLMLSFLFVDLETMKLGG